jgi:hypothetical protein
MAKEKKVDQEAVRMHSEVIDRCHQRFVPADDLAYR